MCVCQMVTWSIDYFYIYFHKVVNDFDPQKLHWLYHKNNSAKSYEFGWITKINSTNADHFDCITNIILRNLEFGWNAKVNYAKRYYFGWIAKISHIRKKILYTSTLRLISTKWLEHKREHTDNASYVRPIKS